MPRTTPAHPLSIDASPRMGEVVIGARSPVPALSVDEALALMPGLPRGAVQRIRAHAKQPVLVVPVGRPVRVEEVEAARARATAEGERFARHVGRGQGGVGS